MAGESQISRFASSPQTVSDIRFEPIRTTVQKAIVTREEMDDLVQQFNDRLQTIQNAYNAMATTLKVRK
jgi:hypothetical protein